MYYRIEYCIYNSSSVYLHYVIGYYNYYFIVYCYDDSSSVYLHYIAEHFYTIYHQPALVRGR